jgi:hypothetical protein
LTFELIFFQADTKVNTAFSLNMKKLIRVSVRVFIERLLRQGDLSSVFDFSPRTTGYNGLRWE